MKNLNSSLIFVSALAITLFFTGCKKGETGPQGPAGTNGTNGKDGNANVKSNNIFINANEWINKVGYSEVTKLVPEITSDIVNKGTVNVFLEDGSNTWVALPATIPDTDGFILAFTYYIQAGKLTINVSFNENVTLPAGTIESGNWKIVTIAGSAKATSPSKHVNELSEIHLTN